MSASSLLMPFGWFDFLVIALAGYRLALMLSTETGPFSVFERLRVWLTAKFPGKPLDNEARYYRQHWVVEGVNCPLCVGFYVTPLLALFWASSQVGLMVIVLWLALTGLQTFITKLGDK